jgi:phosphomannomutase
MDDYVEKLRQTIIDTSGIATTPLKGLKVCVNAGNGAGGFFATSVLAPLGADVSSSINLEPDGAFPNHPANPEDKKHVAATIDAVAASGADVGVMLDCDVDRCGLIDGTTPKPEPVNRNRLVALAAQVALEDSNGVIVTDPVTSGGMTQFIEERGGTHDRFKMGYRNVIDRAAETKPEPALLAIETSGHSAWRSNNFVDDGCYTAAKLLGRLAKARVSNPSCGLLDLLGGSLKEPAESIKVKMPVASLDKVPDAEVKLCDALKACESSTASWRMEPVNHDGLRCSVGDGDWLIARASLHEPVVSLQMEADDAGGTAAICAAVLPYLRPFEEDIDLAELEAVAKSN